MPGTRQPQHANDFNKADLLQVLLTLQAKVNRDLHVATLCTIDADAGNHMYKCSAFPKLPNRDTPMINAICIRSSDERIIQNALNSTGEHGPYKLFALLIMTDFDSDANYHNIITNDRFASIETTSALHSYNNAVIAYIGDSIDGKPIEDFIQ